MVMPSRVEQFVIGIRMAVGTDGFKITQDRCRNFSPQPAPEMIRSHTPLM